MNSIKTIVKFELARYFLSPLAYVYLICFLILSGSLAVYFGHFFSDGNANLWTLFDYQPWVYLLFIPGISMRCWAEEFRSKSVVSLLTTPVSIPSLVLGKFFASWVFAIFAIAFTFPFWIIVNVYGAPDNIVIFISYLGCFLLAGAMLAISQTMSALTQNPVISLVLSVLVNLLFFWSGFDYVLFWARELFSEIIVETIISFSFLTHFSSLSRGLVELRDLIFFGSLITFFNMLTISIIRLKTKGTSDFISSIEKKHGIVVLILLFIGFFSLNIIANNLFRQINYDFTEERYLSLTKNTKDILRKLNRPITAKLYYSPVLGQRNPKIREYFDQIKLLLKQYKTYGNGKFDFRIYMPDFLDKTEDVALAEGLQPIPLVDMGQNALFGISFSDDLTGKSVIPFFSFERQPFIEQDLTTSIYKIQHKKKTVGLLSTLPLDGHIRIGEVNINKWEILNKIDELYNIKIIQRPEDINQDIDVLMLVHPYNLSEQFVEKIKKQNKILVLLDVADNASRIYSPENGRFISSDLAELGDYWGINFYDMGVIADFDNSITVDETVNYKKNPSFTQDLLQFKVTEKDFNPNHRITYKLHHILFSSASRIAPKPKSDVSFFPLIKASNNSAMLPVALAKENAHPREVLRQFYPSNISNILAAEILSNNPRKPFDIIAVADTDFIYDSFWAKSRKYLDTTYYIPLFDSANFILNALDYLTQNDDLISLRGKSIKNRPLYKIEQMRKLNIYRYKLKENDIFQAINGARQNLVEITAKKDFEERDNFNADELALIGNIRNDIADLRQQLSALKTQANNNIVRIETMVKFFGIYFIVVLISFLLAFLAIRKQKISFIILKNLFIWDIKVVKLFGVVLVIFGIAVLTVYLDNKNHISKYENMPVFKNFSERINDVSKLVLKNGTETLTFTRKNGFWILEEFPNFPVYQERIRKFLITIAQMTFFEKKSGRVEDMKYFGFSSLKNKKSPMIDVTLNNADGQIIEEFDIGWYDIDIGRGAKAAYIRLANQFQVWLAEADFYDLSLSMDDWTYSTLWNLRFGRFISFSGKNEDLKIMNIVKVLLNTRIISIVNDVKAKRIASFHIVFENDNNVNLVFYKSDDGKYYAKYDFLSQPKGKHLEFFVQYIKDKYLEILPQQWEKIYSETNGE